jgi:PAS domain-containing protein
MLQTEPQGRRIVVNRQAAALTDYFREVLPGVTIADLVNPADLEGDPVTQTGRDLCLRLVDPQSFLAPATSPGRS